MNEKLFCFGMMLMILGVKLKLDKCGEYSANVWLDYSDIFMNRVISVDEGSENNTGITTGEPLVDTVSEGIVIVGAMKSFEVLEPIT